MTGDGSITTADGEIILSDLLTPALTLMARPELCDVGSPLGCTTADAAIVARAVLTSRLTSIRQQCEPAQPLAP